MPCSTATPKATYGGVLDPEDAPRILAQHDLLLFLSYMPSEGTPGIIIEAFQCGVPVIATSIGGVPEQVEHEKSGLLVDPRSVPQLKAAIQRLIDDPALYRGFAPGPGSAASSFAAAPTSTGWPRSCAARPANNRKCLLSCFRHQTGA